MIDREKVIKGLEHHTNLGIGCTGCPYNGDCHQLPKDALELLKAHEPVEPLSAEHIVIGTNRVCANCKAYLFPAGKYCPHCGAEVQWNDA